MVASWPQANIGLVTGEVADVLDIDGPAGRAAVGRFAADHDLRLDGPMVQTGSGNRAGLLEQVDWRGRGGYGRAALEQKLSAVAHAPRGRRNHALYRAGIRLYGLVAGGVLARDEVEAGLLTAAETSRLLVEEPTQTRRTLISAERTGLAHPRGVPAQSQPGHSAPVRRSSRHVRGSEDRERSG